MRIVLEGLRGEYSIAELCLREGIAESLYYSWSKEFLEAGKRRLNGDTERAASACILYSAVLSIFVKSIEQKNAHCLVEKCTNTDPIVTYAVILATRTAIGSM